MLRSPPFIDSFGRYLHRQRRGKKVKNKFTWHWHVEGCRLCTICSNKNAKYFNSIFMSCCGKNSACFLNKHLTFRVYAKHELYGLCVVFVRVSQFLVDVTTLYTNCEKDTTFQHNILDVKWVVKSCLQDNPPAAFLLFWCRVSYSFLFKKKFFYFSWFSLDCHYSIYYSEFVNVLMIR